MFELIAEYDRMYKDNPVRWDLTELDKIRFETLKPYMPFNSLLDVGCGSGHTLEYFSGRLDDVGLYGLDLSPVAVAYAQTRLPGATIQCATVDNCTFTKMDVVMLGGVAEHFVDLPAGLAAVRGMMADYGIAYMEVPNCITYKGAHGRGFYKTRADGQTEWHMTRPDWETVLTTNGFEIVKAITGPQIYNEFIWILKKSEE